ncbi:CobQ/CobB/MinD/ParA nucleotide binding domain-containing protein [Herbaspirillum sp. HC18]|nr:CobQ/CobB/MinD/ParA nucleotide binding domain-containing protein [Herbaspirillum sp. HC18]
MNTLRINAVSSDRARLDHISQLLHSEGEVSVTESGLDKAGKFAESSVPDVLIADSTGNETQDLESLDRLAHLYPGMSFIVLREQQSPEFLIRAMRIGVREVLPAELDPATLKAALERVRFKMGFAKARKGKIFAVASCKGGSGSTLLAANLAHALASTGNKVALFDFNLQFGDALLFLSEQKPPSTLSDIARDITRLDAAFLASSMVNVENNLSALAAPEDPAQGIEVKPAHIEALLALARRHYDFIVLDVGRGLDAHAVKALDHADMIFPVLQITMPYIRDGKRLLDAFRSLGYPNTKLHVVVNRYQKGGNIGLEDLERSLGHKVMRVIPNHYEAAAASVNQGVPIARLAPASPISKALKEWSESLAPAPVQESEGWIARLFKRAQKA